MLNLEERHLEARTSTVIPISTITKRLEKNRIKLPFVEKMPDILDIILNNKYKQNIKKIYFFGSYAYGKPNSESDIDICVIIDENISKHRRDVALKIALNLISEKIIPYDILVYNENLFYGFVNPQGIENEILKRGKLVYERG
jgi:predicted nucleotidyltransferase